MNIHNGNNPNSNGNNGNNNGVEQPSIPDDDISLILRHLIHHSSSTSSPSVYPPPVFSASDRLSVDRVVEDNDSSLNDVILSSSNNNGSNNPVYFPVSGGSSDSLTGSAPLTGFDHEDYDGESEDTGERTVAELAETKQSRGRSQSKRSRAAEVHNLSEKRRRSRINEKMKALQNLIPNSNKTDKASMLDEAIEYLKQLQLQVQMLSIKNGLSLHPMCLPGVAGIVHPAQIPQVGMDLGGQRSGRHLEVNPRSALDMTSNTSDSIYNLPKHCGISGTRPLSAGFPSVMDSEPVSFGLDSCVLPDFGPFDLHSQGLQDHFTANNIEPKTLVTREALVSEQRVRCEGIQPNQGTQQ